MDECKDVQKLKSWGLAITKYPSLPDHTEYPTRIIFKGYEYFSKRKLISFLEDKIRELNYNIYKYDTWHELGEDKGFMKLQVDIYQEVLDFINKGGKE